MKQRMQPAGSFHQKVRTMGLRGTCDETEDATCYDEFSGICEVKVSEGLAMK